MEIAIVKADLAIEAGGDKPSVRRKRGAGAIAAVALVPPQLLTVRHAEDAEPVRGSQGRGETGTVRAEGQVLDDLRQTAQTADQAA